MSSQSKVPCSVYVYGLFIAGAIALAGTSLCTTHWIEWTVWTTPNPLTIIGVGLFRYCNNDQCFSHDEGPIKDYLSVEMPRYLLVVAAACYCITLVIIAYLLCRRRMIRSKNIGWAALTACIVGAMFAWSSVGYFANKTITPAMTRNDDSWNYAYSYYLASGSGAISVCAGIAAFMAVITLFNSQNPGGRSAMQANAQPEIQAAVASIMTNKNNSFPLQAQNLYQAPTIPQGMGSVGYNINSHNQGFPPQQLQPQYFQQGVVASPVAAGYPLPPLSYAGAQQIQPSSKPAMAKSKSSSAFGGALKAARKVFNRMDSFDNALELGANVGDMIGENF